MISNEGKKNSGDEKRQTAERRGREAERCGGVVWVGWGEESVASIVHQLDGFNLIMRA